jgi:hypothetical protein
MKIHTDLSDLALLTYTHTACKDVWPIYFGQVKKFLPEDMSSFVLSNDVGPNFAEDNTFLVYDESDPYYIQYTTGLDQINQKYILYAQEDFILYDRPNVERLMRYLNFLEKTDYSFVRLIRSGFTESDHGLKHIEEDIYDANTLDLNSFPFQMQATVWKKSDMRSLYKTAKSPLHLEPAADWPGCMRLLGLKGTYCYNGEVKQGKYHWGTTTYPHIVSAVQRGKWNTFQHDGIILEILNEYNIDPNDRGMRTQY